MALAVTALANLKKFKVHEKMVEATISFIVTQLASRDEMAEIHKAFNYLDKE